MISFKNAAAFFRAWRWLAGLLLLSGAAVASREHWLPYVLPSSSSEGHDPHAHGGGEQAHTDHGHAEHAPVAADFVRLSPQAQANIGLTFAPIKLGKFERTVSIPGMVVERTGRSTVEITAPLTGVITRIYPIQGEAVTPGQLLFDVQMTHEELITTQSDFLKTAEEMVVIRREIARLEKISAEGAFPAKTQLERKYELEKRQGLLHAQRQALLLHGMSDAQVDAVLKTRELLRDLTVIVPKEKPPAASTPEQDPSPTPAPVYQIQQLKAEQGQHVTAGDRLCVLANHARLYIEGKAFEQDVAEISAAIRGNLLATARIEGKGGKSLSVPNLKIVYLSNEVDRESRVFSFFVMLPNELVHDAKDAEGHRFIDWRYKPGQRMQIRIPVETWNDRIVLPLDALAQDGVETYVFLVNGNRFVRRPVHVQYRDDSSVVIANDGSIDVDDYVAVSGATHLHLQLKNQAGGGVDPHAGHSH